MSKTARTQAKLKSNAKMIDVSEKTVTERSATACAFIQMSPSTLEAICKGEIEKGDVFTVARVAAIQAAKETPRYLPLCHPILLTSVEVECEPNRADSTLDIRATVSASWKTGVEMEALCAVSAAALTVYDMCKSRDRGMTIMNIQLEKKEGGRSGTWMRNK